MTPAEAVRFVRLFDDLYENQITELSDIEDLLEAAKVLAAEYEYSERLLEKHLDKVPEKV